MKCNNFAFTLTNQCTGTVTLIVSDDAYNAYTQVVSRCHSNFCVVYVIHHKYLGLSSQACTQTLTCYFKIVLSERKSSLLWT